MNKFNLVEESWIPTSRGLVSLIKIFTETKNLTLGGNPIQKIAVIKLLLAIAQTAHTPKNKEDWAHLGASGLSKKVIDYLKRKKGLFWLYGEKPFLQMPSIKKAKVQGFGAVQYHISTGNTTVLTQSQKEKKLTDAEKALLILTLMGFALGGKKTDNSITLTTGYTEKGPTGKPGTSLGFLGYLHNFILGQTIRHTIWLNLLNKEELDDMKIFTHLGKAPWEDMPSGENCPIAHQMKRSYIGRLIPLNRFLYLTTTGLHYSEGINHPSHKEGMADLSVTVDWGKKIRALWSDPQKAPWRELTSFLSFLETGKNTYDCPQLRLGLQRIGRSTPTICIWSGGIRVSNNAGEQYISGKNNFVESELFLQTESFGEIWFAQYKNEIETLNNMAKIIFSSVNSYLSFVGMDKNRKKASASQATNLFWSLCERDKQKLIDICENEEPSENNTLRHIFIKHAKKSYNAFCPRNSARQLEAWAAKQPNFSKFSKKD